MAKEVIDNWNLAATELMARTGMTLQQAVAELDIQLTTLECDAVIRRKSFNRLLWEARHRYFSSLGKDPNFTQDVLIGRLLVQSQKLEEQDSNDKAAEVLLKIAKIRGWVGPENQVSIFGELSQSDLDKIRDTLTKNDTRPSKQTIQ